MSIARPYDVEKVATTSVPAEKINDTLKSGNIGLLDCGGRGATLGYVLWLWPLMTLNLTSSYENSTAEMRILNYENSRPLALISGL
ncbi:hypothetical protein V495_03851 [Pseudogymnoascus sp. VKM F-4514 (FW-929)]|nr:hypothetical protein V495_03851 [Pseudogymnoascus sp. VKM F-4514 (FW-929)]KFY60513.1 hypothetical protein V497_03577 [Pseudogymnoascus sp. VKM F-4516 (FW-969)]